MTSKTAGPTPPENLTPQDPATPEVNTLTVGDITASLKAGGSDFLARPYMSGFFGLFYAVFGILFVWSLVWLGKIWMILPAAIGFPLIAPFAAAGLYEISRRLQRGEDFGWANILTVIANQRKREMGWMAFVTLFIFWVWMYQIRLLIALCLGLVSFASFDEFLTVVFTTTNGWVFLGVGHIVGAALALILFSITVVSMPLLLERDIDIVTAMITSVKVVFESPFVMLGWGAIVTLAVLMASLPFFAGLLVVLPILGHATWHIYRKAVPTP